MNASALSSTCPAGRGKYIKIWISREEQRWEHRHVMECALGRRLLRDEHVHHLNGNKSDNRLENLAVIQRREHVRMHSVAMKRKPMSEKQKSFLSQLWRGEKSRDVKLTEKNVRQIRRMWHDGLQQKTIALVFGVSRSTIGHAIHGKTWAHIPFDGGGE